jgi:hypothetical protein
LLFGAFGGSSWSLIFETLAEQTYPFSESFSGGIFMLVLNLFFSIVLFLFFLLPNSGWYTTVGLILAIISTCLVLFVRFSYRRSEYEELEAQSRASTDEPPHTHTTGSNVT